MNKLTHVVARQALPLLFAALACSSAAAQCELVGDGPAVPGVFGTVYASCMWDPDGVGPLDKLLVIGGDITIAGGLIVQGIVTHNLRRQLECAGDDDRARR